VPSHDGIAGAPIRILSDPARAEDATITDFQQSPFEVVSHACPPGICRQ
jgi:hypothetical protein